MASLLGQFFSLIKGSQEDIASIGLAYVLQSSETARETINQYIFNNTNLKLGNINYSTQKAGEKLERPDISGLDDNGKEVIIFEAKFWAALTKNQPVAYLKRLTDNSVLIFICPKLREISLFEEIDFILKNNGIEHEVINNTFKMTNKHILITDWNYILELIKSAMLKNNENISDIEQIIGFCEIIESTSFLPIKDDELSPSIAKRINSFTDLIDKIIDNMKIQININLDKVRATPQKYGYTRYFIYNNFGIALELNLKYWESTFDTPFWLTIENVFEKEWQQTDELKKELKITASKNKIKYFIINDIIVFPIVPLLNQIEEDEIKYITDYAIKIIKEL